MVGRWDFSPPPAREHWRHATMRPPSVLFDRAHPFSERRPVFDRMVFLGLAGMVWRRTSDIDAPSFQFGSMKSCPRVDVRLVHESMSLQTWLMDNILLQDP